MKKLLLVSTVLLFSACTPMAPSENPDAMMDTSSSTAMIAGDVTVDWKVWPSETDDEGTPHSSLFLTVGDEDVKIGDYMGAFGDLRANGGLKADELMHGQYWWAGGGEEFMVKRTAKGIDVLHRPLEEEVDIGAFTVVKSIPLAADAKVTVAPARGEY